MTVLVTKLDTLCDAVCHRSSQYKFHWLAAMPGDQTASKLTFREKRWFMKHWLTAIQLHGAAASPRNFY
jgi:hypothetical protein